MHVATEFLLCHCFFAGRNFKACSLLWQMITSEGEHGGTERFSSRTMKATKRVTADFWILTDFNDFTDFSAIHISPQKRSLPLQPLWGVSPKKKSKVTRLSHLTWHTDTSLLAVLHSLFFVSCLKFSKPHRFKSCNSPLWVMLVLVSSWWAKLWKLEPGKIISKIGNTLIISNALGPDFLCCSW